MEGDPLSENAVFMGSVDLSTLPAVHPLQNLTAGVDANCNPNVELPSSQLDN